jgi:hypothetical protein
MSASIYIRAETLKTAIFRRGQPFCLRIAISGSWAVIGYSPIRSTDGSGAAAEVGRILMGRIKTSHREPAKIDTFCGGVMLFVVQG